ncbi:MAG: phosphotransferase [Bdellovibrio sp.]
MANLESSQYEVAKAVIQNLWKGTVQSEENEYLNGRDFLLFLEDNSLANFLSAKEYIRYTHGDLNPSNILIKNDETYMIDWDMFGKGYFWFDILSLLVHPMTRLTSSERHSLIQEQLPDLSSSSIDELMHKFGQYKVLTLSQISGAEHLVEGYRNL